VQAAGLGELDGVPADGPGRAGDRHGLAWPQGEKVEREAGGQPGHRQGRCLGVAGVGGCPGCRLSRDGDELGVGAVGSARDHDRHGVIAQAQVRAGALADLVDQPGGLPAGHVGRRDVLQPQGRAAAAQERVGRVDRCCGQPDPDLAGSGLGRGEADELQDVRPAELGQGHGFHSWCGWRVRGPG
jgi:hypothetical protein